MGLTACAKKLAYEMKSNRLLLYCFFTISLAVISSMCYQKWDLSRKDSVVRDLLQKVSIEERKGLNDLCRALFFTSEFGYTLFGDKPISVIVNSRRFYETGELSFFQKHLFSLVRRYKEKLNTPHFALLFDHELGTDYIWLVNKKAFRRTVQQNIAIFRYVLGEDVTPDSLLDLLTNKNYSFHRALQHSHLLFGTLFGYGITNSFRFDWRDQLVSKVEEEPVTFWKGITNLEREAGYVGFIPLKRPLTIVPGVRSEIEKKMYSLKFHVIRNEVRDLNKKLVSVAGATAPFGILSSPLLPQFAGDPENDETQKLEVKYKSQLNFLTKKLSEESFLENMLETFYYGDGS